MHENLIVIDHPLARHLVTHLRDETTKPALFRTVSNHLTVLLALEATRDLPTRLQEIRTPLEGMVGEVLAGGLVVVPILRAGLGMLGPIVELFPEVAVGYIGLARDHTTAVASSYYCKLPPMNERTVLVTDPMLATGGSASQAITAIKKAGATRIRLVCVVAAPEGVARVHADHPDVPIYLAALDRELNPARYILPGLGDYGDRLYGT
ncbi:MAG: uracil phosphoribosyltransferase [Capsulimonadales bacterium]|nr:uracil phosphoribosyltransferase [Capsulimonadales bacterium]